MADSKITALTEDISPISTDLGVTVDDPGGTPSTKKATLANIITKAHGLSDGIIKVATGVMSVVTAPTGDIVGTTDTQTLTNKTLGTTVVSGGLQTDATPDTDHTANGPTTDTINAGATIAIGEVVYLASDGEWALTDADATGTAERLLGIALEAGTDGSPMLVALPGSFVRDDTWAWTVGAPLYLSTTAGDLTETAPSATDDVVRVVGYAISADVIYFMPQQGVIHA